MKKVFLKAYLYNNLGDDLFVKNFCEKYKNCHFYALGYRKNKSLAKIPNLTYIYCGIFKKALIHISSKILKVNPYELFLRLRTDAMIYIGGSIFVDTGKKRDDYLLYKIKKPYYVSGFNLGPYKSNDYVNDINEKVLKNANGLSVRDQKTYNLVRNKQNLILAPDMVFTADFGYEKNRKDKYAIISVINVLGRFGKRIDNEYENLISNFCGALRQNGITPILMSFCKKEGDEEEIERLREKCCADTYLYNGDLGESLSLLCNAQLIMATRFHASIIAILNKIRFIPIAYSEKTVNSLLGLSKEINIVDMQNLKKYSNEELMRFSAINQKCVKLDTVKKEAWKHFDIYKDFMEYDGLGES